MFFRLSQKLAKKLKERWPLKAMEANEEPLADWSGHLFIANRAQYIILCNTESLYTCLFYGRGVTEDNAFFRASFQAIRDTMTDDGLKSAFEDRIVPKSGPIYLGKALNRSITGCTIEQINYAKAILEDGEYAPYQIAEKLNGNLLSPLDYKTPREVFRRLCEAETAEAPPRPLPSNVLKFERPRPRGEG